MRAPTNLWTTAMIAILVQNMAANGGIDLDIYTLLRLGVS